MFRGCSRPGHNQCERPWERSLRYSWGMQVGGLRGPLGLLFLASPCALLFLASSSLLSGADFVGSNVCRTCHPTIYATFNRNPHYKSLASGREKPENTGCESCHGPGQDHVTARGGKTTIVAFSQLAPEKVVDACLRCHSQTLSRANIRRSEHTQRDIVCTNCHSIHSSPAPKFLLAKQQTDLCYGCHASVRAQFSMPFKHRVNED